MYTTPRRPSQVSHQPSLSANGRDLADNIVVETESDGEGSIGTDQAAKLQLERTALHSGSSRSTSSATELHSLNNGATTGVDKPSRRSIIGGTSAVAATSSREALSIYNSIEKSKAHSSMDKTSIDLSHSPFKPQHPSHHASLETGQSATTSRTKTILWSSDPSSRQLSMTPVDSLRRSERIK